MQESPIYQEIIQKGNVRGHRNAPTYAPNWEYFQAQIQNLSIAQLDDLSEALLLNAADFDSGCSLKAKDTLSVFERWLCARVVCEQDRPLPLCFFT